MQASKELIAEDQRRDVEQYLFAGQIEQVAISIYESWARESTTRLYRPCGWKRLTPDGRAFWREEAKRLQVECKDWIGDY